MKIYYTRHSERKFKFFKELGWNFSKRQIKKIIKTPHNIQPGRANTKIVLSSISETHSLRIVYVATDDIITIITFYPVAKGRYG